MACFANSVGFQLHELMRYGRAIAWVSGLAASAFLIGLAQLGRTERGGPRHAEVMLARGVPGTLYLPGTASGTGDRTQAAQ